MVKIMPRTSWDYYGGEVVLEEYLGGDLTVVNAARISFDRRSDCLDEKDRKLIRYLAEHKHMSPFRHIQLQLSLHGIPEFVLRQLYKHQVGIAYTAGDQRFNDVPWNEASGRYTEVDTEFFVPEYFRTQAQYNKQASGGPISPLLQDEALTVMVEAHTAAKKAYEELLAMGVAREQARLVIPLAFRTSLMWTASLEALVHFVLLRRHPGAQAEIYRLAEIVEAACVHVAPLATAALLGHVVES